METKKTACSLIENISNNHILNIVKVIFDSIYPDFDSIPSFLKPHDDELRLLVTTINSNSFSIENAIKDAVATINNISIEPNSLTIEKADIAYQLGKQSLESIRVDELLKAINPPPNMKSSVIIDSKEYKINDIYEKTHNKEYNVDDVHQKASEIVEKIIINSYKNNKFNNEDIDSVDSENYPFININEYDYKNDKVILKKLLDSNIITYNTHTHLFCNNNSYIIPISEISDLQFKYENLDEINISELDIPILIKNNKYFNSFKEFSDNISNVIYKYCGDKINILNMSVEDFMLRLIHYDRPLIISFIDNDIDGLDIESRLLSIISKFKYEHCLTKYLLDVKNEDINDFLFIDDVLACQYFLNTELIQARFSMSLAEFNKRDFIIRINNYLEITHSGNILSVPKITRKWFSIQKIVKNTKLEEIFMAYLHAMHILLIDSESKNIYKQLTGIDVQFLDSLISLGINNRLPKSLNDAIISAKSIKGNIKRDCIKQFQFNPVSLCITLLALAISITGIIQVLQGAEIIKPISNDSVQT